MPLHLPRHLAQDQKITSSPNILQVWSFPTSVGHVALLPVLNIDKNNFLKIKNLLKVQEKKRDVLHAVAA